MARNPKDAIVLCLDVGPAMLQAPPGAETPLESSLKIISIMLQRKIFSESKDEVALVLFGTEETHNELADEDGESYQNITVVHPLCIPSFELLERVAKIKPESEETDFLDAVTVGLDILHKQTQGKKIEFRRLVLFTNFDHQFSDDNLDGIVNGFQYGGEDVQLNVIAPQFEDPLPSDDDGSGSDGEGPSTKRIKSDNRQTLVAEKPKTPQQRAGERLIGHILQQGVDGCVYSYDQAVLALTMFEKKSVRSMPWKCHLTLGSELSIPCAAYAKTKADNLKKSWTKCYAKTNKPEDMDRQRYYHLHDNEQTEVKEENVSKGYKYGKDVIPFSKEDEAQMKYKTEEKCLAILGFTDSKNIRPQDLMDDQAHYVMAEKDDQAAAMALSALITALHNQSMYAVARYVYRKGLNPKIMALIPKVKASYRCLVMVPLPFAEDVRPLEFPGLHSTRHPAPSKGQLDAVDRLIDGMDLCAGEKELYRPQEIPNPYFQRVYHCLNHRALHPKDQIPPPDQRIEKILAPNQQVMERSKQATAMMVDCFKLVKEEVKAKKPTGIETWGNGLNDNIKKEPSSDQAAGDAPMTSDFTASAIASVGSVTPEHDFLTLLNAKNDDASVPMIFEQLQQRILQFVMDSFMVMYNKKVIPCLITMKQQASQRGQVDLYNSFLKNLKNTLLEDESRKQYWDEMISRNITLIVGGSVTDEDVQLFLAESSSQTKDEKEIKQEDDSIDDLLDEL